MSAGAIDRETRFVPPMLPAGVVPRVPVQELLDSATGRLAVVAAPSGYGKSAQVALWSQGQERATAWADLAVVDNDPATLLDLLVGLLVEVTDFDPTDLLVGWSTDQWIIEAAPAFGRLVRRCRTPFVLVLDDIHRVVSHPAIDLLGALASNVPPESTIVLAGRAVPSTPIGRLRVHPGVVNVTDQELALDRRDAANLLVALGLAVPDAEVERLVAAVHGWPVGVLLAARRIGTALDPEVLQSFDSHDAYVAEYVREEWISELAPDDLDFLTRVAPLEWLSGPLCDHVLDRAHSDDVLQRIHHDQLVVIPLDQRGEWYRMHPLLRDVLDDRFRRSESAERARLHERASEWFEARGEIERSIHHAVVGGNSERAEQLVIEHSGSLLTTGRHMTILNWLDALPIEFVTRSAPLCVIAGTARLDIGDTDGCTRWLDLARALPAADEDDRQALYRGEALRAAAGRLISQSVLDTMIEAREHLRPGAWRALAMMSAGIVAFSLDHDDSVEALTEAVAEAHLHRAHALESNTQAHLAFVLAANGDWTTATDLARRAHAALDEHRLGNLPAGLMVTAMSSVVDARAGDADRAMQNWTDCRYQLGNFEATATFVNVAARWALIQTSALLNDQVMARTLRAEAKRYAETQPEATRLARLIDELPVAAGRVDSMLLVGAASLTAAELRTLRYLPTNLSLNEIASRLYVSRNTVKSHAAAIYRKLGTTSRGEAVDVAREAGLLPDSLSA